MAKNRNHRRRREMLSKSSECYYCRRRISLFTPWPQALATIDHKVPKCRGGTNAKSNLVLACSACNGKKSDMTAEEYFAFLEIRKFGVGTKLARELAMKNEKAAGVAPKTQTYGHASDNVL